MNEEDEKVFEEIMDMAWHGYYKSELLRVYCEYAEENGKLPSGILFTIMTELKDLHKKIIDEIDEYTTAQAAA